MREGFPESWEISMTPTPGGTAERRKRSAAEVIEKSERSIVAMNSGNRRRRDPKEPRGRRSMESDGGAKPASSNAGVFSTRAVWIARSTPSMLDADPVSLQLAKPYLEEPDAVVPHVRICGRPRGQPLGRPDSILTIAANADAGTRAL